MRRGLEEKKRCTSTNDAAAKQEEEEPQGIQWNSNQVKVLNIQDSKKLCIPLPRGNIY